MIYFISNRLDMLVTHSSAVFPALDMWANGGFPIRSFTLINPAGHRRIVGMKPAWFIDNLIRCALNPVGRAIFRKIGKIIFKLKGVAVRVDSLDDVIHAGTVMFLSESEKVRFVQSSYSKLKIHLYNHSSK